jgi:hypothetical protein
MKTKGDIIKIFYSLTDEYLIDLIQNDRSILEQLCMVLSLDIQLMKESGEKHYIN